MYNDMFNGKVPYKGYIVEELLLDEKNNIPDDYKCYVFGGKLYYIALIYDRKKNKLNKTEYKTLWMTSNWEPIYIPMSGNNYYYKHLPKPDKLDILIKLVEKAGKYLDRHCRIDVYIVNNKIYFGEFTFFCGAFLHTIYCNTILGLIWQFNPDSNKELSIIKTLIPDYYCKID